MIKRVYADAGLIVAAVMGPSDPFHEVAMRFLKEAERAGVSVVVTDLALMEAVDVLRKRTKMRRKCRDGSEGERREADAAAAAAVDDIYVFVATWQELKVVEIFEVPTVALDFNYLHGKMLKHPGQTPSALKGNSYRHDGVGPIDLIHIVLARLAGVQAICTTDRAIAQLKDDPMYGGMEVITLPPRPAPAKTR